VAAGAYAIVFGGLGCWISSEKGRESAEGIFLGLLFGPLGCLIAVLMPTPPPPAAAPVSPEAVAQRAARLAAEQEADRQADMEWRASQAKQGERARAAAARLAEEKQPRTEARDQSYWDRGVEPGPLAWFQVLPDWFQATLLGVAISVPFPVGVVVVASQVPAPWSAVIASSLLAALIVGGLIYWISVRPGQPAPKPESETDL
jgi:hypothetical protein